VEREERAEELWEVEGRYAGYSVYDQDYEKIGKVDDLFVDEGDQPEYLGVKMGFLGTRSTLIPFQMARVNDERRLIQIMAEKEMVKNGPTFDDDREITPEFEEGIYSYYGLQRSASVMVSPYGGYYSEEPPTVPGIYEGDTDAGKFVSHAEDEEGVHQRRGSDLADDGEIRVQRTEEELRAGTRERQADSIRVRKRVRTDREHLEVPTRREEVSVERVPLTSETSGTTVGEGEIRVPVTEEEVVVEKRPVVKEEVRIRKDVVEDTEVVEADVRREEIEVEDETDRRSR
jgi:uncharacterized protein (TIGR02271 family)